MNLDVVVAGLHDLALEGLSAADEVADLLVGLGRDVDEDEAIIAIIAGELDGVPAIGLVVVTGPAGDQGGRGQVADDTPLGEGALEDVTGAGGLVAGADGALGLQSGGSS